MKNNLSDEAIVKLEALQKEYEAVLQQYQEAVNNYITTLESATDTNTATLFTPLKGRSWWGTRGVAEGVVDTQEQCETMCANAENCSGATFNPVKRYCWARGGNSALTPGVDDDVALLPQQKAALIVMRGLNNQLISIANEISEQLKTMQPKMEEQQQQQSEKQQQLNSSYQKLLDQKWEMEKQLIEYNSVEQDYENQTIYANQENVAYRFWVLFAIVALLITVKRVYGSPSSGHVVFWVVVYVLMLILTYNLTLAAGFAMWSIWLLVIILMKLEIIPSM